MKPNIFDRIESSKNLDFGAVFSESFELYKKTFSIGLQHSLIIFLAIIPFMLLIYVPMIPFYMDAIQNAGNVDYRPDFMNDFSPLLMVGWVFFIFIVSFLLQVVNFSILGHYLKILKNIDTGTNDPVGGYLSIAKTHFGKIIILSLATMGIALLAALLCYFPIFYVMVPLTLVLPIFVFNEELEVSDIIKAAFKLGNKNWLVFFGLIIVSSIISSLGMIACYIGIIATMFFSYIVYYQMYKNTIGFDIEETPANSIEKLE